MGEFCLIERARKESRSRVKDGESTVQFAIGGVMLERLDRHQSSVFKMVLKDDDTF